MSEILKNIEKESYYSLERFKADILSYTNAVKEGRMVCVIQSVSNSGMSRVLQFYSCEKTETNYYYRQYRSLFSVLGYKESKNRNGFKVGGCGMDMIFATNYDIINTLIYEGFIGKELEYLSQKTPTTL